MGNFLIHGRWRDRETASGDSQERKPEKLPSAELGGFWAASRARKLVKKMTQRGGPLRIQEGDVGNSLKQFFPCEDKSLIPKLDAD